MLRIGIVGSEAAKFTAETEQQAKQAIIDLVNRPEVGTVISGGCHLGGIDTWAAEIGKHFGRQVIEFFPLVRAWSEGYKPRNLAIAEGSDEVWCITVRALPESFKGMRFPYCYHCRTAEHVKSGGCWTVKQALRMGKRGGVIVVG